jgi:hypothetical protein
MPCLAAGQQRDQLEHDRDGEQPERRRREGTGEHLVPADDDCRKRTQRHDGERDREHATRPGRARRSVAGGALARKRLRQGELAGAHGASSATTRRRGGAWPASTGAGCACL